MPQRETVKTLRASHLRTIHPGTQIFSSKTFLRIGLLLRLVPAWCLLIGLFLFWDNAFGLQCAQSSASAWLYIGTILLVSSLFYAMRYSKVTAIVGGILFGLAVVGLLGLLIAAKGTVTILWDLVRGFFNTAISHMMTVGYGVLYVFKLDTPYTAGIEERMALIFFLLLQIVVSAVVGGCVAKRIRVIPIAVITGVAYTVVFLYNISTAKWGFALSFVGVAGLLTMCMADKYAQLPRDRIVTAAELTLQSEDAATEALPGGEGGNGTPTDEEKSSHTDSSEIRTAKAGTATKGSAAVGWGAGLCSLLALLAAAVPAAKVENIWKTYESIDTVMETIRAYEMALITGEDMQITDLGLTGAAEILEARSSIATPRSFTGKTVLEIQSNITLPIYLRSWISTTFADDLWHVADEETRDAFDETFGRDFRAEDLTYRFLRNLNPRLVKYNSRTSYANHEEDGYMTTLMSLKNMGVAGNILFLPSRLDSEVSLLQFGSLEEPYQKKWINYFDGIAYSRAFHKGAKYSAVVNIPLYKEEDWMQTLNQKLAAYDTFLSVYNYVGNDIDVLFADEDFSYASMTAYRDLYTLDRLEEYYLALDDAGQAQFARELAESETYNDYVANSGLYTSLTEDEALNARLTELAWEIVLSSPLPDTGLSVEVPAHSAAGTAESTQTPGMAKVDLTDYIGMLASETTVRDVIPAVFGTDKGNIYYADDGLPPLPADEEVVYIHYTSGTIADAVAIENETVDVLNETLEDVLSRPLVTVKEIRGSDNSLIDIAYHVNDAQAFKRFLRLYLDEASMQYYRTAFAQRIAQYLSENMTYTLNPTLPATPEEEEMSSVERFLFVTKEGYCVQYATSATLLLRALGIPTRYVEGYIAPKFVKNAAENRQGNYLCNVKDSNAHAWCEIYLDNYGWLTTEVTTPYYSDLYDPYESVDYNRNWDDDAGSSTPTEVEEVDEEEEEDTFWDKWGSVILTVTVMAAVIGVLVYLLVRFFESRAAMRYRHETLLADARRGQIAEHRRAEAAQALYDNMRRLAAACGFRPIRGETPEEYMHRMDIRFKMRGDIVQCENGAESVLPIIEKNEFGTAPLTEEELAAFADYLVRLEDIVRGEAGVFTMFRIRYLQGLM